MPVDRMEKSSTIRCKFLPKPVQGYLSYLGLLVLLWFCGLALQWPLPAQAAVLCRSVAGHEVCILQITRSAKHHWEYRAVVSVDGRTRPQAVYDCRSRESIQQEAQSADVPKDEAGTLICSYFQSG